MTAVAAIAPTTGHNSATFAETLEKDPSIVFTDPKALPALLAYLDNEIAAHVPDLTTKKGREAITKLTSKIVGHKTSLDALGKEMNEEARAKINVVDEVRRKLRTDLDALRDRARKPLTDWEAAEDDRKTKINEVRTLFADACDMPADATLEDLAEMSKAVEAAIIDPAIFGDLRDNADAERIAARVGLAARKAKLEQAEADRIELERLRTEKAEAERKAAEAAAAEAKKKADDERIAAAAKRAAEEAVEAERKKAQEAAAAVERERAAEQAKRDAEAAAERAAQAKAIADAEEARRQADAKAQAAIDEANRKAKAAEEALEAERRAEAEKVEAARKAKAAQDALDAERQRNLEHRSRVMGAAKQALMDECEVSEAVAKKIILSIVGKSIPHVSMEF